MIALSALVAASLPGFNVRGWQDAGSDFKTVYASGRSFLSGVRAYNFPNLEKVFAANHVIKPFDWFAHAPTYPPFTFITLAPVIALPMVTAVYVWMALGAAALVGAIWSLGSAAERTFGLSRPWRLAILVAVAASPLTSFGLQIGNVSVVAGCLCIMAVATGETTHPNWRAAALTVSILLKPHVALCLMVGMLFSRNRSDRALVFRTGAFFVVLLLLYCLWGYTMLPFGMQFRDYAAMVHSEIATGCLNPRSREFLNLPPQITSLESMIGYFLDTPWMQFFTGLGLALFGGSLIYLSRTAPASRADLRLQLLGTWSTFGLLATYHRTHDAIILFLLLPWILGRLHRNRMDWAGWGTAVLLVLQFVGPDVPGLIRLSHEYAGSELAQFLVFREASLVTLLLLVLLLASLLSGVRSVGVARRLDHEFATVA